MSVYAWCTSEICFKFVYAFGWIMYQFLTLFTVCMTFFLLQIENLEVWFQRPKDVVRKLVSGDLDIGIVGLDTVSEYGQVLTEMWSNVIMDWDKFVGDVKSGNIYEKQWLVCNVEAAVGIGSLRNIVPTGY